MWLSNDREHTNKSVIQLQDVFIKVKELRAGAWSLGIHPSVAVLTEAISSTLWGAGDVYYSSGSR